MTGVLLVDDEPLVLIGMQGMLNWAALGYEVVGTARNGVPFYSLTFTFFMLYYMWLYMIFWGNCN